MGLAVGEKRWSRTGELWHGAPAALAVVEEEADELLVTLSQHGCLPIDQLVVGCNKLSQRKGSYKS